MISLYSDKDLASGYVEDIKFQEMYIDTDVFYKLHYLVYQFGLADYFSFDIDQNGRGVYVRIVKKEEPRNEIC